MFTPPQTSFQARVMVLMAVGVISVSFLASIYVMVYDFINRPGEMLPSIVTTFITFSLVTAGGILGVNVNISQMLQHVTTIMAPQRPQDAQEGPPKEQPDA